MHFQQQKATTIVAGLVASGVAADTTTTTSPSLSSASVIPTATQSVSSNRDLPAPHFTFRCVVEEQVALTNLDAEEDELDPEIRLLAGPVPLSSASLPLIELSDLFNFADENWHKILQLSALRSFDEELELLELLDLDAEGELEDGVDIDNATAELVFL